MFARTERLTLRPAWPEDAAALTAALGDAQVATMLARVPHPYTLVDAIDRVQEPRGPHQPRFLIEAHEGGAPRLIGGIAVHRHDDRHELAYWLTPAVWGRGYATEAGRAVIDMARHALPIARLDAWHFVDNPASGRVLRKLGFRPTGTNGERHSCARGAAAPVIDYALDLDEDRSAMPIAA
ncbi:GNAT family N-acetyltransferase [Sphingomonas sp. KR1UV-12]|uniref:GNAT family N-acetyltransferase n=1 Tax=Sphingomonas aurea TaxID=3063994 RepID=A0ABT9EG75_9SPHN|nr:GNAT family N-acetyltransferase [Sphingomonas sp. KR1UV-12]MDP1025783.1 GNAT family N-acetyltransferase [Sphingomonas sp. KR1UV-12]